MQTNLSDTLRVLRHLTERAAYFRVASAVLFISLFVWAAYSNERGFMKEDEITYASRLNQSIVDLANVSCLLVDPKNLFFARKIYDSSAVLKGVEEVLSIHPVLKLETASTCRWGLAITVVVGEDFGVRNNGHSARYLVSPNICEWDSSGQTLNPNRCLAKTIYVFSGELQPSALFQVGLTALKQPQTDKLQLFQYRNSRRS